MIRRSLVPVFGTIAGASLLAVVSGFRGPNEVTTESAKLAYQAHSKWTTILPGEVWTSIDETIDIPHADGDGFAVEETGPMSLAVDTNADGRVDKKVKGVGGFLKLRADAPEGGRLEYAVRIRRDRGGWSFAASGSMRGKLLGQVFHVIDQNNNGVYNDYGEDAMVVGPGDDASFLSRVVNLDGELYDLEVSPDGHTASVEPFVGDTGTINLAGDFESRGKLLSAVVSDRSRDLSFNVARHRTGLQIPAGSYRLEFGFAQKAGETAYIRTGKMRELEVASGGTTATEWGAPLVADFSWDVSAGYITVNPDVAFYGSAGEEYHSFRPNAKSPKLFVWDKQKRKLLLSGRFGGC